MFVSVWNTTLYSSHGNYHKTVIYIPAIYYGASQTPEVSLNQPLLTHNLLTYKIAPTSKQQEPHRGIRLEATSYGVCLFLVWFFMELLSAWL